MSSLTRTTGASFHPMIGRVLFSAIPGGLVGVLLELPVRQLVFVTMLGPAIVLLWHLQRGGRMPQPTPAALPDGSIKTEVAVAAPQRTHVLFEEGPALSAEQARRALDDFLVDQQADA